MSRSKKKLSESNEPDEKERTAVAFLAGQQIGCVGYESLDSIPSSTMHRTCQPPIYVAGHANKQHQRNVGFRSAVRVAAECNENNRHCLRMSYFCKQTQDPLLYALVKLLLLCCCADSRWTYLDIEQQTWLDTKRFLTRQYLINLLLKMVCKVTYLLLLKNFLSGR